MPTVALPPGIPLTDQITAGFTGRTRLEPERGCGLLEMPEETGRALRAVAENCCLSPARICAVAGVTTIEDDSEEDCDDRALPLVPAPQPTESANTSTRQFINRWGKLLPILIILPLLT